MKQKSRKPAKVPQVTEGRIHPELRNYVCYCLHKAAALWRTKIDSHLAGSDLVVPQFGMLVLLDLEGPMTQNELGAYVGVDKATMVRFIDGLEEKKWVLRVPNKEDRRANHLEITRAGKQAIQKLDELRKQAEKEFLSPLNESERNQLRTIVNKLIVAV